MKAFHGLNLKLESRNSREMKRVYELKAKFPISIF